MQFRRASKRSQDILEESVQFPTSVLTAFLNCSAQTALHRTAVPLSGTDHNLH